MVNVSPNVFNVAYFCCKRKKKCIIRPVVSISLNKHNITFNNFFHLSHAVAKSPPPISSCKNVLLRYAYVTSRDEEREKDGIYLTFKQHNLLSRDVMVAGLLVLEWNRFGDWDRLLFILKSSQIAHRSSIQESRDVFTK